MSEPYLGMIQTFGFNFAPRGWATCDGQILGIAQNTALFSLLGTTYGGNGTQTFGLPDLRGRVQVHQGSGPGLSNYVMGQVAGQETVTLNILQMPQHTHVLQASPNEGNVTTPIGNFPAAAGSYATTPNGALSGAAASLTGGSQPHTNLQPYLTLNVCIALEGIFPSRN